MSRKFNIVMEGEEEAILFAKLSLARSFAKLSLARSFPIVSLASSFPKFRLTRSLLG